MVYIWGNYNTTGVAGIPLGGSTLNNGGYIGAQVPSSIVCDAFFPLSKTWFDSLRAMFPEGTVILIIYPATLIEWLTKISLQSRRELLSAPELLPERRFPSLTGTPGRNCSRFKKKRRNYQLSALSGNLEYGRQRNGLELHAVRLFRCSIRRRRFRNGKMTHR